MRLFIKDLRLSCHGFEACYDLCLEGAAVALFGPSGSGKTTLLEAMAGLRACQGRIELDGQALHEGAQGLAPQARGLGYVPQDLALFPHLGVRENLCYGLPRDPGAGPKLQEVVDGLGLQGLLDKPVTQLSGGERRRVALGRALLAGSRLLLLDEPTANLDRKLRAQVSSLLKAVQRRFKVPFILVSHDPQEIRELCTQVAVLDKGRCVAVGNPSRCLPRQAWPASAQARPAKVGTEPGLRAWLEALC